MEAFDEVGRNTPVSCDNNSRHREDDFTNSKKIHRAGSVANAFRLRSELQKLIQSPLHLSVGPSIKVDAVALIFTAQL